MKARIRTRIFEILEVSRPGDFLSRFFDVFIISLIALNVIAVILETVESLSSHYGRFFNGFEVFSIAVFTAEYLLRIWSCTADKRFSHPLAGRIRFALTPMLVIDLSAILPFYVPMLIPIDLRFMRALRLFRIFRLFKLGRYSRSLRAMGNMLRAKKEELLIAAFGVFVLLVIASSLMYFVEHEAQPEAFSSIPAAMWWGVATLTTVGYGDVYPVTILGKFLGAVISVLGVGMFALPAGIIASGFIEEFQKKKGKQTICPHCGKSVNELEE